MSEQRYLDETGAVTLVVIDGAIAWVSVANDWAKRINPAALGLTVSQLLLKLRRKHSATRTRLFEPPLTRATEPEEIRRRARATLQFVTETQRYLRQAASRTDEPAPAQLVRSRNSKVTMWVRASVPGNIQVDQEWADNTPAAGISESLTQVLEGIPITEQPAPASPELIELDRLWRTTISGRTA